MRLKVSVLVAALIVSSASAFSTDSQPDLTGQLFNNQFSIEQAIARSANELGTDKYAMETVGNRCAGYILALTDIADAAHINFNHQLTQKQVDKFTELSTRGKQNRLPSISYSDAKDAVIRRAGAWQQVYVARLTSPNQNTDTILKADSDYCTGMLVSWGLAPASQSEAAIPTRPPQPTISGSTGSSNIVAVAPSGDGTYSISGVINGTRTVNFILDSGASKISLPEDIVADLMAHGQLTSADFAGNADFTIADGSVHHQRLVVLHELTVGGVTLHGLVASVGSSGTDPLLGLSFLSRFRSFKIDNQNNTLTLE